jgi:hypothetical protein
MRNAHRSPFLSLSYVRYVTTERRLFFLRTTTERRLIAPLQHSYRGVYVTGLQSSGLECVIAADPSAVLHPACSCRLVDPCRLAWLSRPAGSTGELAGGVVGSASYRIGCEVGWRDEKVVNGKYRTVTAPPPRRTSQTHVAAPRTRPRPLLILLSGRQLIAPRNRDVVQTC